MRSPLEILLLEREAAKRAKDQALNWLRQRFEIPDAEWLPGTRNQGWDCPMAVVLSDAGYQGVWVGHSLVRYCDPNGTKIRVRLPWSVSLFPRLFDIGYMPELETPKLSPPQGNEYHHQHQQPPTSHREGKEFPQLFTAPTDPLEE